MSYIILVQLYKPIRESTGTMCQPEFSVIGPYAISAISIRPGRICRGPVVRIAIYTTAFQTGITVRRPVFAIAGIHKCIGIKIRYRVLHGTGSIYFYYIWSRAIIALGQYP
ncbi:hypothetical protein D3C80_1537940 [compost metagenome]